MSRVQGALARLAVVVLLLAPAVARAASIDLRVSSASPAAPVDPARELLCLAQAVYYEAADQPLEGRRAVAQVVLNRLHSPAYPKTVCGVVYQGATHRGCQFTFACDGSLARLPTARNWQDAQEVAGRALAGFVAEAVGASTHYHALWVRPSWSLALTPTVRIGAHQFYRLPDGTDVRALPPPTLEAVGTALPAVAAPAVPQASAFSIWGLQVARVAQEGGGAVITAVGEPAGPPRT